MFVCMHGSSWTYRISVLLILITTDIILVTLTTQNNGLVERLSYYSYSKNLYLSVVPLKAMGKSHLKQYTIWMASLVLGNAAQKEEQSVFTVTRDSWMVWRTMWSTRLWVRQEASQRLHARPRSKKSSHARPSKYVPTEWNRPVVFLTEICMFYNFDERGAWSSTKTQNACGRIITWRHCRAHQDTSGRCGKDFSSSLTICHVHVNSAWLVAHSARRGGFWYRTLISSPPLDRSALPLFQAASDTE